MNVFILMLAVTACYTITSLSDKYAIAEAKFSRNEFSFLMCASMSVFIALCLPFQEIRFVLSWQAFAAILLIAICKMLEFQMSALVLQQLSAFELKAWLGITLFASYITDIFYGADPRALKFACILVTVLGLVFIAKSAKEGETDYRKILLPLVLYLASKYGYGMVIKAFSPYISSTMQLLPALVLLAIISISLANYSFIQPMILVTLFFIGLIRKERRSRLNLIGSLLCVAGVLAFQLL